MLHFMTSLSDMMSLNPKRSWAKTYNQMWNFAMHEPIQKNFQTNGSNFNNQKNFCNKNSHGEKKCRSGSGCWKFNKNQPCDASNCNFEHKCSYCGAASHAVIDCNKLKSKGDAKPGQAGKSNQ